MKRKGFLYENIYKLDNIEKAFNEVCRNTKNKRKVAIFREYKTSYISKIHDILESKSYVPGPYNIFTIFEPKKRRIVSQSMIDKIINHLISRHILYPSLMPCLLKENVASRKNLGTNAGLVLRNYNQKECEKLYGNNYYILKCDISKFFASIDHDILKIKLRKKIKDEEALKIVFSIIDSDEFGLSIGNMTSQVLAIFYLNDMDHFIKENLKIKYYVRYQDDFLLYHQSKDYLNYCLKELEKFLQKEKLVLNKKTRIFKGSDNFIFLGRNKHGKYAKYRTVKRKLKKKKYLYYSEHLKLSSLTSTLLSFSHLEELKPKIKKSD